MTAGRKCKLTNEMTNVICENIELGMSYRLACQSVNICPDTFSEWMKNGEAGEDEKFVEFHNRVRHAESVCAKNCLLRIKEAFDAGTWTAAAWLIERRFREYRKDYTLELDAKNTGGVSLTLKVADCGEDI